MAIFLTALILRLAAGGWTGNFDHPVAWEYEEIADNLLKGRGFVLEHLGTDYRAYLSPLYPFFCAAIYLLTHHDQILLLTLQCAISALVCLQVRSIGTLVFENPLGAQGGAWLVAFHPGLILYASRLHSLTLDLAAFLWALWAWCRFLRNPNRGTTLHVSLASGVALLARGTIAPFLLLAALWAFWVFRRHPRKVVGLLVLMGLVTGGIVAPWLVRNAVHFNRFPLLISTGDQSFWAGNNPNASGSLHLPDGRAVLSTLPEGVYRRLLQLDELGQAKLFRQEALRFIREHPLRAFQLYGKKLFSFWWFSPQTGLFYPPSYTRWYRAYYLGILLLALGGFWKFRRRLREPEGVLLIGFALSIALLQSLYYVDGRHRWTVEPVLLLLAAGAIPHKPSGEP